MKLTKQKEQVNKCECLSKGADCAVIVVAAGTGERFGSKEGKALAPLAGLPLFTWAVTTADVCASTAEIVVVVQERDFEAAVRALEPLELLTPVTVVCGGETRQESVYNGLLEVSEKASLVAVQDGARPLTPSSVFELVAAKVRMDKKLAGAIAGRPATDTVKIVRASGEIAATPNRDHFFYAETPQTFHKAALMRAYVRAREEHFVGTDDASLVEHYGGRVATVPIEACNIKVTYPDDLLAAEMVLIEKTRQELQLGQKKPPYADGSELV